MSIFSRRAVCVVAAASVAVSNVATASADTATYYSTKQPYFPAGTIDSYSKAPEGFQQIYTSSVNRHGSRGLSSFKYDDLAGQMLTAAKERGQLTELGERLIPQVEAMSKANRELTGPGEGGYGNLTAFGRAELSGIGERNARRNAELFDAIDREKHSISFLSSGEDRAIESGWYFGSGLLETNPELTDNLTYGAADGHVELEPRRDLLYAHKDKTAPSYEAYKAWADGDVLEEKVEQAYAKPVSREAATSLLGKIFAPEFIDAIDNGTLTFVGVEKKDKTVEGIVDAALQFYNLYIIAPAMEEEPAKPAEGWIFDEYMDESDGPTFAYLLDVEDYYEKGPAIAGQTVSYDNFAPLLDHMLAGVRERAEGGDTAAEFRFGHAETIVPLAALLKLPGSEKGVPANQVMDYSNSSWRGDKVTPMGANIQWDAFQNDNDDTIVRMLYNEAEVPFHSGCVPIEEGSMFYTLDELEDCLPLGATSDHAKARLTETATPVPAPETSSSKMGAPEVIAIAVAAFFSVWALLGLGGQVITRLMPR